MGWWYCSGPRRIQGCSLHDDTFLGSRVLLAEVSLWEALRRPWCAVSLGSPAPLCSQVAWMPGWDWQQLAWNERQKPKREGKERSHPFLPLPPLGLTFLVTGRRDRGDGMTAGWRDVKRQWELWGCRLKAFYLGTRRAKAQLTEDVTFFVFLSGTALAAPALGP